MSSTTGLSRTRSIRKPAAKDDESAQNKPVQGRNETRNASPSRLPMRPPTTRSTTSSTTASSSTTVTRTRAPTGLTSRQVSGNSSTKVSTRPAEREASATAKPVSRAQSVRQIPSTKTTTTTSSNGIGRSASTGRPRSSSGLPSTGASRERHLGHSRAKSTITSLTSLTAATTLRPLSHAPSRSNPSPAPSTASSASTATTTQTAATSSTRTQTRSQTKHARVPSQSQSQPHSSITASNLAARRPTFNIHQQHYSPAKSLAPKPLTSTFLAPPSPSKQPVNVALTAETSRLQTELLQLSLLHREAHAVSASWHASARSKFGARFKEIVAADQALQALEREGAETRGLQDLIRWGNASPEPSDENEGRDTRTKTQGGRDRRNGDRNKLPLDEKVQLLDQVLNGVWALGESGGRYERTMRAFEDWAFQVAEIRAAQRGGDIDGLLAHGGGGFELGGGEEEDVSIFVSDLDVSTWKRDHAGLVRMLEGWRRTLTQLGHVHANLDDEDNADGAKGGNETLVSDMKGSKPLSGLARTLRGCRILVRDMLAELNVMEQIELDALAAEEEWMEQMEARLSAEEEASDSRRRRTEDVPPWKLLTL